MKNIISETDRIKELMGVEVISEQVKELEKEIMTSIKKAFGKRGVELNYMPTSVETKLSNFISKNTEVDDQLLNYLKENPEILKNLKTTLNDVKGFKRLTYLNKVKELENRLPTKSIEDLSQESKTLFADIAKGTTFTNNDIKFINTYVDKLTSNIPFYNKISAMDTIKLKNILEPLGQDVQKAINQLKTEIDLAKKSNDTKRIASLNRFQKYLNEALKMIMSLIETIGVGTAKAGSSVVGAISKKVLYIIGIILAIIGLGGYFLFKDSITLNNLVPDFMKSSGTDSDNQSGVSDDNAEYWKKYK